MADKTNNLITYLNLNDPDRYQSIYFSQLYGTFFGIYAKFQCDNSSDDGYTISSIDLQVINYKGLLNMGITRAKMMQDSQGNNHLVIEVQAVGGSQYKSIECNGEVLVKKEPLYVTRICKRMHGRRSLDNGIFDEEFYYREGVNQDYSVDDQERNEIKPDEDYDNPDLDIKSGLVCPKSTNIII